MTYVTNLRGNKLIDVNDLLYPKSCTQNIGKKRFTNETNAVGVTLLLGAVREIGCGLERPCWMTVLNMAKDLLAYEVCLPVSAHEYYYTTLLNGDSTSGKTECNLMPQSVSMYVTTECPIEFPDPWFDDWDWDDGEAYGLQPSVVEAAYWVKPLPVPQDLLDVYKASILPSAKVGRVRRFQINATTDRDVEGIPCAWLHQEFCHALGPTYTDRFRVRGSMPDAGRSAKIWRAVQGAFGFVQCMEVS